MLSNGTLVPSFAARKLITAGVNAEGSPGVFERLDLDGTQIVKLLHGKNLGVVEEGSVYIAETPTAGTGVKLCTDTATSLTATAPSILILNTDTQKNLVIDAIKLVNTVVGVAETQMRIAFFVDLINRYTSGGNAVTPVNPNSGVASASIAKFYDASTAIVAPAAGSGIRKIDSLVFRTAIPVVGDSILFDFGSNAGMSNGVTNGTAALNLTFPVQPVVVGPGHSFLAYIWAGAGSMTTAPSWEYVVSWIER